MSNSNLNPPNDLEADQLTRLLELELAHKRTEWKRAHGRARRARVNAIALLFFLIAGIAFALLFLFSRVSEERAARPTPSASESPR